MFNTDSPLNAWILPLVAVAKETRLRVKSLASTIGMTQSPAYYDEIDGDLYLARSDAVAAAVRGWLPGVIPST